MKFITAAIMLSLLTLSCSTTKWAQGEWLGEGIQVDGQKWKIDLLVNENGFAEIWYPTLSCGGRWKMIKESSNVIEYKEFIEMGQENCDQGVEVHLKKIDKNHIELVYYLRSYDAVNPIATAKMTK